MPDKPDVSEGEKNYARKLNAMRKVVFSRTLKQAEWHNSQVFSDIDAEEINNLKQEDGKDILIYGSASIVQQLTNLGLIDEYQILVLPAILGGGKPLFKDIKAKRTLKLVSVKSFTSGVVVTTYQV